MNNAHSGLSPSPWVERFASLIPRNGTILDLACGAGRHTRFLTGQDYNVVALDRDVSKLGDILEEPRLEIVEADPVVKGQTASSSYKPAKLENGMKVMVPPHIDVGTRVVVNTEDCSYVERAKN